MAVRYEEKENRWRVDIRHKGLKPYTKCFPVGDDSKEEAEQKAQDNHKDIQQQLLDGKPLGRIRAKSQITLREAFENTLNNPEVAWLDGTGEPTAHGRKMKYYAKMFYNYFGANKPLREIKKGTATMEGTWYNFISQFGESNTNNRKAC